MDSRYIGTHPSYNCTCLKENHYKSSKTFTTKKITSNHFNSIDTKFDSHVSIMNLLLCMFEIDFVIIIPLCKSAHLL